MVLIVKTNLKTQAQAHVILLSCDLELSYQKVIDYYSLRFQIEFNFREAKQFWGERRFHEYHRNSGDQRRESLLFYGAECTAAFQLELNSSWVGSQSILSFVARLSPEQLGIQPSGLEGLLSGL